MRLRCGQLMAILLLLSVAGWSAPGDAADLIRSADALLLARQYDRARTLYERALAEGARFDTDLPHVRNLASTYLHSTPPDLPGAIRWLRIGLALDSTDDGLRSQLASALLRSGDISGAVEHYRILADAHPHTAEYVVGLANALRQTGQSDAALRLLGSSVERFPNVVPMRVEYARLLNFTRQFAESKRQFLAALALDPQNLIAQVGVAKATSFAGDQESAIPMYDRILERHSGLYDAIVGKAFALLWSGRADEARPLLVRAQRMHPEDTEVREALSELPASRDFAEAGKSSMRARSARSYRVVPETLKSPGNAVPPARHGPRNITTTPEQPRPLSRSLMLLILAALLAVFLAAHWVLRLIWRRRAAAGPAPQPSAAPSESAVQEIPQISGETGEMSPLQRADDGAELRPGATATAGDPGESQPPRPRLRAVLIGGPDSLLELESRWLPNFAVRREYKWELALAALLNEGADLVVLNPMTHDAWTSSRMQMWIESNEPSLRGRVIAVSSTGAGDAMGTTAYWLLEPFSVTDWRRAVMAALASGVQVPVRRRVGDSRHRA